MKSGKVLVETRLQLKHKPFSLRLRMALAGALLLVLALGLVGIALSTANQRSAITSLQDRTQSWAYLVLAAAEPDSYGQIQVSNELGDPRLSQPGSGIFAVLHGNDQYWISESSLGMTVPELPMQPTGVVHFGATSGDRTRVSSVTS